MTHLRRVMATNFFAATGFGQYAFGGAVYNTRFTSLTASEVGIGLTVAGLDLAAAVCRDRTCCDRMQTRRAVVLTWPCAPRCCSR